MNPILLLHLAESRQQELLAATRLPLRALPAKPVLPPSRSAWSEILRVYRIGFAAKP